MELRVCIVVACLLGTTLSAPAAQQSTRNFIPNRYEVRGELMNDDGSFSRQDPEDDEAERQSFLDNLNNGQDSNLAYQPQNDFQQQNQQYGSQAYGNFQAPNGQFNMGGQDQQAAFYNPLQYQQDQQTTNDMPFRSPSEDDDIAKDSEQANDAFNQQQQAYDQPQSYGQQQSYDQQQQGYSKPQQDYQNYQQDYNEQPQQGYFNQQAAQQYYQPETQNADDMQGFARDKQTKEKTDNDDDKDDLTNEKLQDEDESSKRDRILKQRMKKYQIPSNLSNKDRQGMLGFQKQIYLRGGH